MKKVRAAVIYPVFGVEVEVKNNATDKEIREALMNQADLMFESTSIEPLVDITSGPSSASDCRLRIYYSEPRTEAD